MKAILKFTTDKVLHLGMIDEGAHHSFKNEKTEYFKEYHEVFWDLTNFWGTNPYRERFRGEAQSEWISPKTIKSNNVSALQGFLVRHGFMPYGNVDGIFGYKTLAGVRLFQEYVRSIEGVDIGPPDGRVGSVTHGEMMRWKRNKLYCEWGPKINQNQTLDFNFDTASNEYKSWFNRLNLIKQQYLQELSNDPSDNERIDIKVLRRLEKSNISSDSLPVSNWSFDPNDIHLIGLRSKHDVPVSDIKDDKHFRGNDDLFIVLMNGFVFKFWGSTDPEPYRSKKNNLEEPYLIETQHKYKLAWHSLNTNNVYKALRPADKGVMVIRDRSIDDLNILDDEDLSKSFDGPNKTINIHWTGDGTSNNVGGWSAGCQVISGRSYINNRGKLIHLADSSWNSPKGLSHLSQRSSGGIKTRGAYNFLADFVLAYAGERKHVLYTLGRDGSADLFKDDDIMNSLTTEPKIIEYISTAGNNEEKIQKLVEAMINPTKYL